MPKRGVPKGAAPPAETGRGVFSARHPNRTFFWPAGVTAPTTYLTDNYHCTACGELVAANTRDPIQNI